jgi:low affinity Fe/Cu permease
MASFKSKALTLAIFSALSLIGKPTASLALPSTSTLLAQTEIQEPDFEEPEDEEDGEITEDPQGQPNPFLDPELDELVDKKISEDVWAQMLGELPCSVATESCVNQLQNTAIQNSRLLADLQDKIDESIAAVEEAREKNLDSIAISNFSPFLQVFLYSTLGPVSNGVETPVANPFRLILGNLVSAFLGKGLGSLFNWSQYAGNDQQQSRAIAIGDIQIKIAELQRNKAELAQKLREQVTVEALKLEEIARNFQIEQEIAKRDKQRLEIAKVSYRFGEGDSERYLAQLSSYDRQKAATFREWSRLRNQVVQVKLLVLGTGED